MVLRASTLSRLTFPAPVLPVRWATVFQVGLIRPSARRATVAQHVATTSSRIINLIPGHTRIPTPSHT